MAVNHWFCIFWAYRFPVGQLHPRRAVRPLRKIQRQVPHHRKRAHTSHLLQPDVSDVHWTRGEYGRVKWLLSTVQKRFLTFVSFNSIFINLRLQLSEAWNSSGNIPQLQASFGIQPGKTAICCCSDRKLLQERNLSSLWTHSCQVRRGCVLWFK